MIIDTALISLIILISGVWIIFFQCAQKKSNELMPRAEKPTNSMYDTKFSKTPIPQQQQTGGDTTKETAYSSAILKS